jgi:hypothetical protein
MAAVALVLAAAVVGCGSSSGGSTSSTSASTSAGGTTTSTSPAGTSASASTLASIHGKYSPSINPANFVSVIDNRYWPLKPGTGYHYKGVKVSAHQTDDEIVTNQTKKILGIPATIVRDTVSQNGNPVERTLDYYAQDKQGNVWYMGEDSFEKQNGRMVKASDSWLSGVKGGQPGIIMPANPHPGDKYRQEYYPPGQALDEATVLRLDGKVKVPYGSYQHVLVTSEYSPLEPQTEQKYYVPGLGEAAERVVKGHHEEFQLVNVTHH